jgi:regulator of replication initiation timing
MSEIPTAVERFKALLANALERVCVLEEENEQLRAKLAQARTVSTEAVD